MNNHCHFFIFGKSQAKKKKKENAMIEASTASAASVTFACGVVKSNLSSEEPLPPPLIASLSFTLFFPLAHANGDNEVPFAPPPPLLRDFMRSRRMTLKILFFFVEKLTTFFFYDFSP
jgi:hypothetical protein